MCPPPVGSDQPERAAAIYIVETKSLAAAARLLPRLTSPKIFALYAKGAPSELGRRGSDRGNRFLLTQGE